MGPWKRSLVRLGCCFCGLCTGYCSLAGSIFECRLRTATMQCGTYFPFAASTHPAPLRRPCRHKPGISAGESEKKPGLHGGSSFPSSLLGSREGNELVRCIHPKLKTTSKTAWYRRPSRTSWSVFCVAASRTTIASRRSRASASGTC